MVVVQNTSSLNPRVDARQKSEFAKIAPSLLRAIEPYAAPCSGAEPRPTPSAREHLCKLAINLGQASAREHLFGRALDGALPGDQVSAIATHMSSASAALEAAEAGFQPPFSNQRPTDSIRHLLTSMEGYMDWRVGRSWEQRYYEIKNLYAQYRRTLSVTFVSSRLDATRYQPNCDSNTLKACFHLGRASIAAAILPANRAAVRANAVQSDANGNMATAIREGQDVAIDAPREPTTLKVCCSFGSPEAWAAVPNLQPTSPVSTYLSARKVVEAAVASASLEGCGGRPRVSGNGVVTDEAARAYEQGIALWDEDSGEAYRLVHEAAAAGEPRAQTAVAIALNTGNGVPRDVAAAADWYRRAAEQGHAPAQRDLGVLYEQGEGVPKDCSQAVTWYRRAAEQGDAESHSNLGYLHENGICVERDSTTAADWYRRAAEQGDPRGQRAIGYAYQKGEGVPQDCSRAVAWYRRAAGQGYAKAQNDLGYLNENGVCVEQDHGKAADWYERAAAQDHPLAIRNLAELVEQGLGRPRDADRAVELYRRAARLGDERAQRVLREKGIRW